MLPMAVDVDSQPMRSRTASSTSPGNGACEIKTTVGSSFVSRGLPLRRPAQRASRPAGMVAGRVDQSLLEPRMAASWPAGAASAAIPSRRSAPTRAGYIAASPRPASARTAYAYRLLCANGLVVDLSVAVSPRRKVNGSVSMRRR